MLSLVAGLQAQDEPNLEIERRMVTCADLKKERSRVPELVAVTGSAWTSHPLKCELSEKKAVITEVHHPVNFHTQSRCVKYGSV